MFLPTLTVALQLLLLLTATNAPNVTQAPSSVSSSKSTTKTSAPITTAATPTVIVTTASTAPGTASSCPDRSPLTSGELAGIVVVVILIYVFSLLLTAFLVSYYTKKGVLDLDRLIFNRMPFLKIGRRTRDSAHLTQSQDVETNDYIENRPQSSVYMDLRRSNTGDAPPIDEAEYTALEKVSRLPSDSIEQPASSNSLALPQDGGKPSSHSPTTPRDRSRKRDETEQSKPKSAKPKIPKGKPKTAEDEHGVYQNAASMKL